MMTPKEIITKAIEEGARKSFPWPNSEYTDHTDWANNGPDDFRPSTLEEYLSRTHIEDQADNVFKAASEAAASAVLRALVEQGYDIAPNPHHSHKP